MYAKLILSPYTTFMPIVVLLMSELANSIQKNVDGTQERAADSDAKKVDVSELPPQLEKLYKDHGQHWDICCDSDGNVSVMDGDKVIGNGRSTMISPYQDAIASALFEALDYKTYGSMFTGSEYKMSATEFEAYVAENEELGPDAIDKTLLAISAANKLTAPEVSYEGGHGADYASASSSRVEAEASQLAQFDQFKIENLDKADEALVKLLEQAREAMAEHKLQLNVFQNDDGEEVLQICQTHLQEDDSIIYTPISNETPAKGLNTFSIAKMVIAAGAVLESSVHDGLHLGEADDSLFEQMPSIYETKKAA